MGLFNFRRRSRGPTPDASSGAGDPLPWLPIDLNKRYDVYYSVWGEERVYEDVRFVAMRQFEAISWYTSSIGGFLEVELPGGARVLLPSFGIQMICERGVEPVYKVLRKLESGGRH
jgi:hypothetical protein